MRKYLLCAIFVLVVAVFHASQSDLLFAKSSEGNDGGEDAISGSIAVPGESTFLASLAKVSLVDAIQAAVKNTPGKAVSAELEDDDGFLVYSVDVVNEGKVTEVTVDAGNKKILKTEIQGEDEDEDDGEDEGEGYEHGKCPKRGEKDCD